MRQFLIKAALFCGGMAAILAMALFWLPNPAAARTMIGALRDKHARLEQTAGTNRIIFVGGSNLSMGLDSARIEAAFNRPVVNLGINAGLGLRFMLRDAARFIGPGDVVVVVPEYQHFFTYLWQGDMELVAVVFDVCPETRGAVSAGQWLRLIEYMPVYAATKIRNAVLAGAGITPAADTVQGRGAFNAWGDIRTPAETSPGIIRRPKRTGREQVNPAVVDDLRRFSALAAAQHARVLLLPPVYQTSSFAEEQRIIGRIDASLAAAGLPFLAPPERYRFANELFADTAYHVIRSGVALRTTRVIEDLAPALR